MPGLVRKLLVIAAVDGLVLQPIAQRNQRAEAAVKIDYKTQSILPQLQDISTDQPAPQSLEIHGIVGLLKLASSSYLISILRREPVAQLWGKPVYVITDVALIPITSQGDAENTIKKAAASLRRHPERDDASTSNTMDDDDTDTVTSGDDAIFGDHASSDSNPFKQDLSNKRIAEEKDSGIVENVIGRKGLYGRFADSWFSRRGWTKENRKLQGMSSETDTNEAQTGAESMKPGSSIGNVEDRAISNSPSLSPNRLNPKSNEVDAVGVGDALLISMTPKLVQTTRLLFSSRTFFFSYDNDLTLRLSSQRKSSKDLPLHKQADPQYFWNQHLISPFLDAGQHSFVMPVMQGFVGQTTLDIESTSALPEAMQQDVVGSHTQALDTPAPLPATESSGPAPRKLLLTLISRRSVNRAGLRYLRRGIDEDGNVANNVETEQMLSSPSWEREQRIQSFVQIRGSMPIFFSQTPYTFKPLPILQGTPQANQAAMRKHFTALGSQYGAVHAVSLINRHGSEATIGEAYEEYMKQLNSSVGANHKQVGFEWFDFHQVCKGMKFENVSVLVDSMKPFLASTLWTSLESQPSTSLSKQTGIIRTNCMDCLDRTNVVQSAFGGHILDLQLAAYPEAPSSSLIITASSMSRINSLWADNGDAVSRAYAGTAALKGDYTRTRKRNLRGALTDLSLTLSRYYRNLFDDFFAQAAIDYLLGNVTSAVFAEFQTTMTTADPAIDMRRARQAAITTASQIVVEESEDLLAGWAIAMPASSDDLASRPFQEAILLLTDRAVYAVHFDWNVEKVRSFERIGLEYLTSVQWGAYITETMAPAHLDVKKNVGLVVRYEVPADGEGVERSMTRAMANVRDADGETTEKLAKGDGTQSSPSGEKQIGVLAFKALPPRPSAVRMREGEAVPPSEHELVKSIVEEIVMASAKHGAAPETQENPLAVEQRDIISIEEAKKTTGILEQIEYSLKKMVWG